VNPVEVWRVTRSGVRTVEWAGGGGVTYRVRFLACQSLEFQAELERRALKEEKHLCHAPRAGGPSGL